MNVAGSFLTRYVMPCLLLGLSGCIKLLPDPTPPPQKVALQISLPAHVQATPTFPVVLSIQKPYALGILATSQMQVLYPADQLLLINNLQGSDWPYALPNYIESHLVRWLNHLNAFKGVTRSEETLDQGWMLQTDITQFDAVLTDKPHVVVSMTFRLVNLQTGFLLRQKTIEIRHPLDNITLEDIVQGFEKSLTELLNRLNDFLMKINPA